MLKLFLGPLSSSSERFIPFCMFSRSYYGLRRIAAVTGLGRIADCGLRIAFRATCNAKTPAN
eukprot:14695942-Alexandrium_andersonii.AAC.1